MSGALDGVRVLDLSTGPVGPAAAMLLADLGAEVRRVEPPGGDPGRARPGYPMWARNTRSTVVDPDRAGDRERLAGLLDGADLAISTGGETARLADLAAARDRNPGLVVLCLPAVLDAPRWAGGEPSPGLLFALSGMALRQNSFSGGPVDAAFGWAPAIHAAWAACAALAALLERERSGHGQLVTVGGVHGSMVAFTMSLLRDPAAPERPADTGPGGPNPMYTRYRCADGAWIFLAPLTPKFQAACIDVLGMHDLLDDDRIAGSFPAMSSPDNRDWVRRRFEEVFAGRPAREWIEVLAAADVPVGPLGQRADWLGGERVAAAGMRTEVVDPERGTVAMPAHPLDFSATPALPAGPAPAPGEHDGLPPWPVRPAPGGEPGTALPLAGVTVLDLGAVLAGPYAGTLLAELGADVVKVEVPAGDSWRERGWSFIRGQRGLAVDLRSTGGREVFQRLVRGADVVLDNFRPGVLARLGADHAQLAALRPDIVSLSITGYGEGNRFSAAPAFDPLLQALSGMMTAQGGDDEPVQMSVAVNDVTTAALAALGTVAALFHRARTGVGQHVSVTLVGAATYAQGEELVEFAGRVDPPVGGRDFPGPGPLDRAYATRDGWVRLQADPAEAARLRVAGLLPDPAPEDADDLAAALAASLAGLDRDAAVRRLTAAGVPAVPVRRLAELPDDPEYQAYAVLVPVTRPDGPPLTAPGRYALFSRTGRTDSLRPPGVGEHSREVLAGAGVDAAEIDRLLAEGAIRQGAPMVPQVFAAYR